MAGHEDACSVLLDALEDWIHHGVPIHLCKGVDECIKVVRSQVRGGTQEIP